MHTICLSAFIMLAFVANTSWAQNTAPAGIPDSAAPQAAVGETGQPASNQGEKWRYRRHQGLWWYWLPSNNWVYWNDGRWVPYDAQGYAQFNAGRRQAYSIPGNASPTYGPWGPIRYNQYGQRQYPYSQRSSGLQQLGPVPTPGGVRSLPGWGGER